MAKVKTAVPAQRQTRRRYEYQHEYGLNLGSAGKTSRGVSPGLTTPAKAAKRKKAAKKR
jgi:hypothetical protein